MQKVREAPFAFPWRPSFYLLCFSYPPLSLSLYLSIYTHTHTLFASLSLSPSPSSICSIPPSFSSFSTLPPPSSNPHFSLLSLSLSRSWGCTRGFHTVSAATLVSTEAPPPGVHLVPGQPSTPFSLGNQPHPPRHYPSFPYYVVSPIVLLLLLLRLVLLLLLLLLLCAIRFIAGERA